MMAATCQTPHQKAGVSINGAPAVEPVAGGELHVLVHVGRLVDDPVEIGGIDPRPGRAPERSACHSGEQALKVAFQILPSRRVALAVLA
jgi:hypothetical protein